jgi:hypothetical protein
MPHHIETETPLLATDGSGALAAHTAAIHKLLKRTREDIVAIGEHLAAVRDLLRAHHGDWLRWLETEFAWSDQTARRLMHVYNMSRDGKLNTVLNLDLSIGVLYQLAAPRAEAARTEITELIETGATLGNTEVQEILARTKTPKPATVPEKPASPIECPDIPPVLKVDSEPSTEPAAEPEDAPTDANDAAAEQLFKLWQGLEPAACSKFLDLIGAAAVLEHGSREFHKELRSSLPSNPFARLSGLSGIEIAEELSDRLSRTTINTMIRWLQAKPGVKADAKPVNASLTMDSADWSRAKVRH